MSIRIPQPFPLYLTGLGISNVVANPDLNTYDYNPNDSQARSLRLVVGDSIPTLGYVVEYLPFSQVMTVADPVKMSSPALINSSIPVGTYKVYSGSDTNFVERRSFTYTAGTPTYVNSLTIAPSTEYILGLNNSRKTITALPNAEAVLKVLSALGLQANGNLDWSTELASVQTASYRLPDDRSGWVAKEFLTSVMTLTNPQTIASSLFAAIAEDDVQLMLNLLRGVISIGVEYDLIDASGEPNYDLAIGLPYSFNPFNSAANTNAREVWSNAWLGYAIVCTINKLQDRLPIASVKLHGGDSSFSYSLIGLCRSLAYFCTNAISPLSYLSAYQYDEGFDYSQLSFRASVCSNLFLTQLLGIDYSLATHSLTARLYLALQQFLESSTDTPFADYVDRDYSVIPDLSEQLVMPTAPEALIYVAMINSLYAALWSLQYSSPLVATGFLNIYDAYRVTLVSTYINSGIPSDFLASYLRDTLGNTSAWVSDFNVAQAANIGVKVLCPLSLSQLTLTYLTSTSYNIFGTTFNLRAEQAAAQVTYLLNESRRMMPFGLQWAGTQVELTTYSTLGALLAAFAATAFDWYLYMNLTTLGINISTASGPQAIQYFKDIVPNGLLCSDSFARLWLDLYLARDKSNVVSLGSLLGTTVDLAYPQPDPFSIYVS